MMGIKTIVLPHAWVNALFDPTGVQGPERRGRSAIAGSRGASPHARER
jgi:hypothetical protein